MEKINYCDERGICKILNRDNALLCAHFYPFIPGGKLCSSEKKAGKCTNEAARKEAGVK